MIYLNRPMTRDEILEAKDENGYVTGVVRLDINDIFNTGHIDQFCDLLSNALIGDDLLMDIAYQVVGAEEGDVLVEVTGDVRESLKIADDSDEGSDE